MSANFRPTPEMDALLRRSGSFDYQEHCAGQRALAKHLEGALKAQALELPLKRGVLRGDNLVGIYEDIYFPPGTSVEFPLDFVTSSNTLDTAAYTIPNVGALPRREYEGDYLMVPTYPIGNSIGWPLFYAQNARWDVVGRMFDFLLAGVTLKKNRDGWHVLLKGATDRNITVYDDAAAGGLFTKRLVALMKTQMRRSAGGNASSLGQGKLTDLFLSPEGIEDIRSWDLSQIDDVTRRDIFLNGSGDGEGALPRIFGVLLHTIDELGVGQEYQNYITNTLGATLPTGKAEWVVGFDLMNRDAFVRPFRSELEIFENPLLHQERRAGLYCWEVGGWALLNSTRLLLGAF